MKIQRKDILGSLETIYNPETNEFTLIMDYTGFMHIMQTVTEKISPDDLTDYDSIGEAGLTKLVSMMYSMNKEVKKHMIHSDANQAIEQAEGLIKDIQQRSQ